MKNIIRLLSITIIVLLSGCTDQDNFPKQKKNFDERTVTVRAAMPSDNSSTRISLHESEGSLTLSPKWDVDDVIKLIFVQDNIKVEGESAKVYDISENGKQCSFNIVVPEEIEIGKVFSLYTFVDIPGNSAKIIDNEIVVDVSPMRMMSMEGIRVPVWGKSENILFNRDNVEILFENLGAYEIIQLKNSSSADLNFNFCQLVPYSALSLLWYHNEENNSSPIFKPETGEFTHYEYQNTSQSGSRIRVESGEIIYVLSWYVPNGENIPELGIELDEGITSNRKDAKDFGMRTGSAYYIYALWDGITISIADDEFVVPDVSYGEIEIDDNVYVWEPIEETNIASEILEYTNNKIVFKLGPNASGAPMRLMRAIRANDLNIKNFNSNEKSNLKIGDILTIPPNNHSPYGAIFKVEDIQYGPGSVAVIGPKPELHEVIKESKIEQRIQLLKYFDNKELKIEPLQDFSKFKFGSKDGLLFFETQLRATKELESDEKIKYGTDIRIELFDEIYIALEKPGNLASITHFKIVNEGDIRLIVDAVAEINTKKYFDEEYTLFGLRLPPIPLGTSPLYISPHLELRLEYSVSGKLVVKARVLDFTYHYGFGAEWNKGSSWTVLDVPSGRKFDYPTFFMDAKFDAKASLRLGAHFYFMDYHAVDISVGGGVKANIKLESELETGKMVKFSAKATANPFISFNFNINEFGREFIDFDISRDFKEWNLFDVKVDKIIDPEWYQQIPESLELVEGETKEIKITAPYGYHFNIKTVNSFPFKEDVVKVDVFEKDADNKKLKREHTIRYTALKSGAAITTITSNRDTKEETIAITVNPDLSLPSVQNTKISDIKDKSAVFTSTMERSGKSLVSELGFCYSENTNPTILDSKVSKQIIQVVAPGTEYKGTATGLKPSTKYNVRSFARNSYGVAYGPNISFTTSAAVDDSSGDIPELDGENL